MRARGAAFAAGDLRDLQVWQKLAWVDPDVLAADPRARRLVGKGRGFDEHDKASAAGASSSRSCGGWCRPTARPRPSGRRRALDLAVLPSRSCRCCAIRRRTTPRTRRRRCRSRRSGYPEDAALQLSARDRPRTARWFGARPAGVWPSEGSVSDAAAAEVAARRVPLDGQRRGDPGALAVAGAARRRRRAASRTRWRRRPGKSACCSATTPCRTWSASPIRAGAPRPRPPTSCARVREAGRRRRRRTASPTRWCR